MESDRVTCWACAGEDIVYTDVLGLPWCRSCYYVEYLGEEDPAAER